MTHFSTNPFPLTYDSFSIYNLSVLNERHFFQFVLFLPVIQEPASPANLAPQGRASVCYCVSPLGGNTGEKWLVSDEDVGALVLLK